METPTSSLAVIARSVKVVSDMTKCRKIIYDPLSNDQRDDSQGWECRVRDDADGLCKPKMPQKQREVVISSVSERCRNFRV